MQHQLQQQQMPQMQQLQQHQQQQQQLQQQSMQQQMPQPMPEQLGQPNNGSFVAQASSASFVQAHQQQYLMMMQKDGQGLM